jgi:hypothetical protein
VLCHAIADAVLKRVRILSVSGLVAHRCPAEPDVRQNCDRRGAMADPPASAGFCAGLGVLLREDVGT